MLMDDLLSDSTARELLDALGRKGMGMRGHAERVAGVAAAIAAAMKLGTGEVRSIVLGGLLHEVGKLEVADSILQAWEVE